MRILLDECVPQELCRHFPGHECRAARRVGLGGVDNGKLPTAAEQAGYEVIITVDQNIPHQQNFSHRPLALVVMESKSNNLRDMLAQVPACLRALQGIKAGQILRIVVRQSG